MAHAALHLTIHDEGVDHEAAIVAPSAARRLHEAGFRVVKRRPEAFGLLAIK